MRRYRAEGRESLSEMPWRRRGAEYTHLRGEDPDGHTEWLDDPAERAGRAGIRWRTPGRSAAASADRAAPAIPAGW